MILWINTIKILGRIPVLVAVILVVFRAVNPKYVSVLLLTASLILVLTFLVEALGQSEERYHRLVELMPEAIFVHSAGKLIFANQAGIKLAGASRTEELSGRLMQDLISIKQEVLAEGISDDGENYQRVGETEGKLTRLNGEHIDVVAVSSPLIYQGKKAVLTIIRDITDRKQSESVRERAEQTINHLANHDTLTGLPNRKMFNDSLAAAIEHARTHNQKLGVMFTDLDGLKNINDTLGHPTGDQVLIAAVQRLTGLLQPRNIVSRWGGDEFTIIIPGASKIEQVTRIAREMLETFQKPFAIEHHELYVTLSIGISIYPNDGDDFDTVIRHADTAVHQAKELGGNNYQLFTAEMNIVTKQRLNLVNRLRRAVERQEFTVHYQPQLNIKTGKVVGVEALVRWEHPELGLVAPSQFIPLAEETGLIMPIGEWVLRVACAQARKWSNSGFIPLRVAVNISARQFHQHNFVETVAAALKDTGLDPGGLELEITESIAFYDIDANVKVIQKLKEMGVQISLDDFGTGYSSLRYLKLIPIDTLKIDQTFIRDLTTDPNNKVIATAIITLAHSLNFKVIAEGVETEEQLAFLRQRHCDQMQGYLFSGPLSARELEGKLGYSRGERSDEAGHRSGAWIS